mgnify:CR=1 FL=1
MNRNDMGLDYGLGIYIGDAANAQVLGAIADLAPSFTGDRRWRIEHAQMLHPDDIDRLATSGLIPSMQPSHAIGDLLGQLRGTADDGFLFRDVEGDAPALGDVADEFGFEAAGVDVARIGEAGDADLAQFVNVADASGATTTTTD